MSWSESFRAYIDQRFGDSAQQKAAEALGVSPSAVSYWCRGSKPRGVTRDRIADWSAGAVPAAPAPAPDDSTPVVGDSDAPDAPGPQLTVTDAANDDAETKRSTGTDDTG